jgi:hypothetical protein
VNVELQDDFSMDQALSLYLLDTIPLVDPQQPDYALVLLTLVESIVEDPDIILRKQLDQVKDRKKRKNDPASPAPPSTFSQRGNTGDHPNRFASSGMTIIQNMNPITSPYTTNLSPRSSLPAPGF